jgi:outer membrane protein assembly factor BamE
MNRTVSRLCLAALTAAISACSASYVPNMLRPYRPDVQQGNIVTKDMVEQLRPGMTRDQVRFLLGTPMLTDIFHQDRWDYTYYLRRKSGETQIRKLSVVFAEGKLKGFDSDAMPAEPLADTLILGPKNSKPAVAPPAAPAAAPVPAADPPAAAPAPADARH